MISLLFNMGLMSKAPQLTLKLNQKNYEGAAYEFLDITNGGAPGLLLGVKRNMIYFLPQCMIFLGNFHLELRCE